MSSEESTLQPEGSPELDALLRQTIASLQTIGLGTHRRNVKNQVCGLLMAIWEQRPDLRPQPGGHARGGPHAA
jgi:hypothetical protein